MFKDTVYEGNHYSLSMVYKDSSGNPIDLSPVGTSAELRIGTNFNSGYVASSSSILDATGRLDFTFTPAQLAQFATEEKDVELIMNVTITLNGEVTTILDGRLTYKRALV